MSERSILISYEPTPYFDFSRVLDILRQQLKGVDGVLGFIYSKNDSQITIVFLANEFDYGQIIKEVKQLSYVTSVMVQAGKLPQETSLQCISV